ncbi:hypothetical protein [Luteimonas sp. 100069]|uniref:hypothetical protein n=1 Tax=Luteimonas sp. 100069 TaxID=2006109 RepID=UPI000F4DF0D8|nr:hypothetical protein [Luteimonas sp. 100069]RPD88583.1 hypothetical protein EGK76_05465 [Luteimonas sp. 100069]
MKTFPSRALPLALLLACAGTLTACGSNEAPAPANGDATTATAEEGFVARTTRRALETARKDLVEKNISVGGSGGGGGGLNINGFRLGGDDTRTSGLPKAEISPAGDFLVDGKPVRIDDAQRELLLAHRANIIAIADVGITIGIQGARLGTEAAKGAITSALSGQFAEFEKRMEAEGAKIEAEAERLCDRLPALLASQQALAAALPAFQPYATMDANDVEECGKDTVVHRGEAAADAAAETATN